MISIRFGVPVFTPHDHSFKLNEYDRWDSGTRETFQQFIEYDPTADQWNTLHLKNDVKELQDELQTASLELSKYRDKFGTFSEWGMVNA